MNDYRLIYQIGSTQVFKTRAGFALYTVSRISNRALWLGTPARTEQEAIALADLYNAG